MITAVVLAAGRAVRMGAPKQLLELRGRSLVAWVVHAARASRCDDVLVVLGENAPRIGREARRAGARTVVNPRYRDGMGTSLAAGIAALDPACEAAVVLLADQPCLDPALIDTLIETYRATGKPLVISRSNDMRGVPALIGRALFMEAAHLAGDTGGRQLMEQHPDLIAEVPLPPGTALWDVDTPEDFERLRKAVDEGGTALDATIR
jgi:molybdenum cofactor cytidylyltransferase